MLVSGLLCVITHRLIGLVVPSKGGTLFSYCQRRSLFRSISVFLGNCLEWAINTYIADLSFVACPLVRSPYYMSQIMVQEVIISEMLNRALINSLLLIRLTVRPNNIMKVIMLGLVHIVECFQKKKAVQQLQRF